MFFLESVKKIGVFMIFAQVLIHFKPAIKYEKYLKLLISVMVLVQFLNPFIELFSVESANKFYEKVNQLNDTMMNQMRSLEIENKIIEENILNKNMDKIKDRINKLASKYELKVEKIQLENENLSGNIRVFVSNMEEGNEKMVEIDAIQVNLQKLFSEENEESNDNKLQPLRNDISNFFCIDKGKIEVIMNE